jgi:hypothetical protein
MGSIFLKLLCELELVFLKNLPNEIFAFLVTILQVYKVFYNFDSYMVPLIYALLPFSQLQPLLFTATGPRT